MSLISGLQPMAKPFAIKLATGEKLHFSRESGG
jgi:hypothetical protein